jgi:hypothetical protein
MNGNIKEKTSRLSDRALVRAWFCGVLVAACGGVAAVNVSRLCAGALGAVLWVLAGAGVACALACGCVMSGRAAE